MMQNLFLKEHKKVLALLAQHAVDFLVVGGYAVICHGYERSTSDMDIWLKPSDKNRDRFIKAMKEKGVSSSKLKALSKMDFTEPQVLAIGKKPNQIEFLTVVTGLEFEEADRQKTTVDLKNQQIGLLGYKDLITNKMLTDRLQDKADVDKLQKIQRERDKNK